MQVIARLPDGRVGDILGKTVHVPGYRLKGQDSKIALEPRPAAGELFSYQAKRSLDGVRWHNQDGPQMAIGLAGYALKTPFFKVDATVLTSATVATDDFPYVVLTQGNYAYVWHDGAQVNTIEIFDISAPTPVLVAGVPYAEPLVGGDGACLFGTKLYAASRNRATVSIISIADPTAPVVVGAVDTDETPQSVVVASHSGAPYLFVANVDAGNIQAFDVTVPAAPVLKSTTTVASLALIKISGSVLYCVDYGLFPVTLRVFDITNPNAPLSELGSCTLGSSVFLGLEKRGSYLYCASLNTSPQIVDVSDPANPVVAGLFSDLNASINLALGGSNAYVLQDSGILSKYDLTDPIHPVKLWRVSGIGSATTGLAIALGRAYVTQHAAPGGYLAAVTVP